MTRPSCPTCGTPVNTAGESACWRHRPRRRPKAAASPRRRSGHRDPVTEADASAVRARDGGCVGHRARDLYIGERYDPVTDALRLPFPGRCDGPLELDHVRSRGLRCRGRSTPDNLVTLCRWHHRWKTDNAREARRLIDALMVLPRQYGGLGQTVVDGRDGRVL